jgi:titin
VKAVYTGTKTVIVLGLDSIPNTSFTIELFANASPDKTGYGQGKDVIFSGPAVLNTGANGRGGLNVTLSANLTGEYITATATDSSGDTSEFGQDVQVVKI